MQVPSVDIIIPVFNGSIYLERCLKSALAQDYPKNKLGVIVVDDGSYNAEHTKKIIEKQKQGKIQTIYKNNGGVASALNIAIKESRAEWISWLSHDDKYLPNKISDQVNCLSINGFCEKDIVWSGWQTINEYDEIINEINPSVIMNTSSAYDSLEPVTKGLIHGCSLLISRQNYLNHGLFNEDLKFTQDYDLWLRMFKESNLIYTDLKSTLSRQHSKQGSVEFKKEANQESSKLWIKIYHEIIDSYSLKKSWGGNPVASTKKLLKFLITNTKYSDSISYLNDRLKEMCNSYSIDVIVPCALDDLDYLECALNSIKNQLYVNNYHAIVITDGFEINPELSVKFKDFAEFHSTRKGTAAGARNIGMEFSRADFVAFLDADDQYHPLKLYDQISQMLEYGVSASITDYEYIDRGIINSSNVALDRIIDASNISRNLAIAFPSLIVSREAIQNLKFDENSKIGEDSKFIIDIVLKNNSKILYLSEKRLIVHRNSNSAANLEMDVHLTNLIGLRDHILKYKQNEKKDIDTTTIDDAIHYWDSKSKQQIQYTLPQNFMTKNSRSWKIVNSIFKINERIIEKVDQECQNSNLSSEEEIYYRNYLVINNKIFMLIRKYLMIKISFLKALKL